MEIGPCLVGEWLFAPNPQCCANTPHRVLRSKAFRRSCWGVYGFHTMVAISWQLVHCLNRILRGLADCTQPKTLGCFGGLCLGLDSHMWLRADQNVPEGHCCIPSCGWRGSWWCDFERLVYVHVEHVIACLINIFPCFEGVFTMENFASMVDFSLSM
jgi:hypothetical protein